ncbi:hypothetical protein [Amycolatopsis sp. NPDC004378]
MTIDSLRPAEQSGDAAGVDARSPFAGLDICSAAGFTLPAGVARPVFEDDVWSFTEVIGLARYIRANTRILDFTRIGDLRWRRLAKEYVFALMVPRHESVAVLPHAYRTPLGLVTVRARLDGLVSFLAWLDRRGIHSLSEVTQHECDLYLKSAMAPSGRRGGERAAGRSPRGYRSAATAVIEVAMYSELFTDDGFAPGFRPFRGRTAAMIVGERSRAGENSTPPVPADILQPLLAAALYVANALGPHVVLTRRAWRQQMLREAGMPQLRVIDAAALRRMLREQVAEGRPLDQVVDHEVRRRLATGWSPDDPLLPVSFTSLSRKIGVRQYGGVWWEQLRDEIAAAVGQVGVGKPFARDAALVPRADGAGEVPWTEPVTERELRDLVGHARAATAVVIAALSGMRHSELKELEVGCARREEIASGLDRHFLTSTLIKGQPIGGTRDEWVVVQEAFHAARVAEQLLETPDGTDAPEGSALFDPFDFSSRMRELRNWVNGPAGQRLGLAPIPEGQVTMRMLRRTLAIELAYRPGGLLAAKIQLKHISVATTEGYAARPGGAQSRLLAEVGKHERDRNVELLLEEWRNYRSGVLPAGPGARELTEYFASIDGPLSELAAKAPKSLASDQEARTLLGKRAGALHLGPANYCWFTDPSRALCLRLAGTPNADRPLLGMCDSARCPQATHHPCHRPVWEQHRQSTVVFLDGLPRRNKTERTRLERELARAERVIAAIDATDTTDEGVA